MHHELKCRTVTEISTCYVYYLIQRQKIGELHVGSSFGSFFLFFPLKVARDHVHKGQGKTLVSSP